MSKDNAALRKPCNEYPECRHRKHGYTRKDHPAPRERHRGPAVYFRSADNGNGWANLGGIA